MGRKDSRNVTLIEPGPQERAADNKQASQHQGDYSSDVETCESVMINVLNEAYQSWELGGKDLELRSDLIQSARDRGLSWGSAPLQRLCFLSRAESMIVSLN
jgi:hypothetical protein